MLGRLAARGHPPAVWARLGPLVAQALAGETDDDPAALRGRHGRLRVDLQPRPARRRVVAAHDDLARHHRADGRRGGASDAKGRLQAILDHSPMAIYMRDLEQRWIVANAETCGIIGKSAEELLGRPMAEAFPPESRALAANDREVIESGEPQSFDELVADARTGEPRHVWSLKFPVRDTRGLRHRARRRVARRDRRERTPRELAAARALFEAAFAPRPSACSSAASSRRHDRGHRVQPRVRGMLGRDAAELLGRVRGEIVHPDDLPLRRRMIDDVLAGRPAARRAALPASRRARDLGAPRAEPHARPRRRAPDRRAGRRHLRAQALRGPAPAPRRPRPR